MDLVKQILETADRMFMRFGVRSVSMDDVAREISISKKTLYRCFRDKNELIEMTLGNHMRKIENQSAAIMNEEPNPIIQLAKIGEFVIEMNKNINPSLMFDLKKYYVDCYSHFMIHRDTTLRGHVMQNLQKGMEMGFYRPDLHLEFISQLYVEIITINMESQELNKLELEFHERYKQTLKYHVHGIATIKGIEELNKLTFFK